MGNLLSGLRRRSAGREPGGDGTVSRPLIVTAVVLAIGVPAAVLLIHPHSRLFGLILQLMLLPLSLAAFVALVFRRAIQRVARFVVREGIGFAVPASRNFGHFLASEVLLFGVFSGTAITRWTTPNDDLALIGVIERSLTIAVLVTAVIGVVLISVLVVAALRGQPRIELTPGALILRYGPASRTVPWEALRPGLPLRSTDWSTLTLTADRPELIVRRGLSWISSRQLKLNLVYARVHPWFLADVIRFYVDRPERRHAIGTSAEYARLLAELGVPTDFGVPTGPVDAGTASGSA